MDFRDSSTEQLLRQFMCANHQICQQLRALGCYSVVNPTCVGKGEMRSLRGLVSRCMGVVHAGPNREFSQGIRPKLKPPPRL